MRRAIVSVVAGLCWSCSGQSPIGARFSKPMTGKSRYVVNSDGKPVDMGAHAPTQHTRRLPSRVVICARLCAAPPTNHRRG